MLTFADQSVTIPLVSWETEATIVAAFIAAFVAAGTGAANLVIQQKELKVAREQLLLQEDELKAQADLARQSHQSRVAEVVIRLIETGTDEAVEAALSWIDGYLDAPEADPLLLTLMAEILDVYTRGKRRTWGHP